MGTEAVGHAPADRWTAGDTGRLAIAAAVLVLTFVLASRGTSTLEADVFAAVNGAPDWLFVPVWPVMQLGTLGLGLAVAVVSGLALRRPALAALWAATVVAAWFVAKVVKDIVERGRPAAEGLAVSFRGAIHDGYGFVSGHSAVAFALATVIAPHLRGRWWLVPYALATVVAASRLFVGAHLPLDVVGGAALGMVVGEGARALEVAIDRRRAAP